MSTPTRKPCEAQPDLWFSDDPADQLEAIEACQVCPLNMFACRVLGADEIHGVWGGVLKGRVRQVVQPATKTCGLSSCGREFVVRTASVKFCSRECAKTARLEADRERNRQFAAAQALCAWEGCGKRFTRKMRSQRFCSKPCGRASKRKTAKEAAAAIGANERLRELLEDAS